MSDERRTAREAVLDVRRELDSLEAELRMDKGERPSVKDTAVRLHGIALSLGVAADRIEDPAPLRQSITDALAVLYEGGALGQRVDRAALELRKALGVSAS